ncbi:MAG: ABC transporter permease [Oscillospiraceae bacterium]
MTTSTTTDKKKITKYLRLLAAAVFWIAVWELAALKVGQELILPAPTTVLSVLVTLSTDASFWIAAGLSLLRILTGFFAGVLLGTLLAPLTSWSRMADTLLSPILRIVRATPVASFIILALLWIGKSNVPGFAAMLMVTPVVWGNTSAGIKSTDGDLLEMASMYGFDPSKKLRLIYIPSIFPHWNAACVTALGLSWKAGIAAEVLCLPKSAMGTQLYYSKIYLETPSLFAWTAVVIIFSFILEKVFEKLMKRSVKTW